MTTSPRVRRPVAAVLTDDATAVEVARAARDLGREQDRPLLLLVPLPATGFTIDPSAHALGVRRREAAAAAVVGRVTPVLEEPGRAAREVAVQVVVHRAWSLRRPRPGSVSPALEAALAHARHEAAVEVLAPAALLGQAPAAHVVQLDPADGHVRRIVPTGTPHVPTPGGRT